MGEPHKRTGATQAHRSHGSAQEPHKRTGATHAQINAKYLKETQIINAWWPDTLRTTYYVCRPQRRAPPRRGRTQHQGLPSTRLGCPHPSRLAASMKNKKL